ncbi:MAG: gamma-glutamylcyclotransferase family protein [Plesiomonas sp.]
MTDKTILVATYGSLRRNMGNHHVNAIGDGELVGLGKTVENFDIFAYCGGFPSVSLKHSENGKPVVVEVYRTHEKGLTGAYDRLEGYNAKNPERSFYNRTPIKVAMDNGDEVEAWIYHIDEATGPLVESGDWGLYKGGEGYYDNLKD